MVEYLTSYDFLILMIKIILIFGGVMGALAYLTWIERKVMARVQMRPGPTRVGPFGLLQPIADGLKFLFKEDVIPGTCRIANSCVAVFFRYPFWSLVTSNGSQCRAALCLRDHVAWGVRHCAWRMGIEFQVSVDGRDAIVSSNDQL